MQQKEVLPIGTVLDSGVRKYTVKSVLGQGGFGITYRVSAQIVYGNIPITVYFAIKEYFVKGQCERAADGVTMAYSRASAEDVEESLRDFIAEGKRLAGICQGNRNIINVNEVFESNGTAYYVMEFLNGGNLRQLVKQRGRLSEEEALRYILPIVRAVGYIHQDRLLHLDIKPENIMIRRDKDGNSSEPVLIDFGVTLHFKEDGTLTSKHGNYTSRGYSPLEQYRGINRFSPETDVYALAATLYYALVGRDPESAFDIYPGYVEKALPPEISNNVRTAINLGMKPMAGERLRNAKQLEQVLLGIMMFPQEDPNPTVKKKDTNETKKLKKKSNERHAKDDEENNPAKDINNISSFIIFDDGGMEVFYKGKRYLDNGSTGSVINQLLVAYKAWCENPVIYQKRMDDSVNGLAAAYSRNLKDIRQDSTTRFIEMMIYTYRTFDEAIALMQKFSGEPDVRIIQEQQLMALIANSHDDEALRILYDNTFCDVETGGGITEILGTGFLPVPNPYLSRKEIAGLVFREMEVTEPLFDLTACAAKYYCIVKKKLKIFNDVLLTNWPYSIHLYQLERGRVRDDLGTLIEGFITVPFKKNIELPVDCNEIMFEINGKTINISLKDDIFLYSLSHAELTIDANANLKMTFTFKDKDRGEERKFDISELVN